MFKPLLVETNPCDLTPQQHSPPHPQQKNMNDTIKLILMGCEQTKDLEVSLPNMVNQPRLLSKSCEDIITIFSAAKQRLNRQSSPESEQQNALMWNPLLRTGLSQSILIPQSTYLAGPSSGSGSAGAWTERRDEATDITVAGKIHGIPIQDVPQEKEPSTSTPSRRHRRRNNEEDRWTFRIGATRIGNPDIQPDDGYTWRKYGQKEILGSKFPRGYFRCTHLKLYGCHAKKQVQRLDDDPSTFEVTYRHRHTCHMSSTAPSVPPPSLPHLITQDMTPVIASAPSQPALTSTAGPITTWMPIAFDIAGGASVTGGMNAGADIAGPSLGSSGREEEFPFATSIGDMVLNYGVGHSSGIDFMFPYMEERWKGGDQK